MLKRVFKSVIRQKSLATTLHNFQSAAPKEIEIFIDGNRHMVDSRMTIFQACYSVGVIIPRFCYHEKLSIAGNCRMCLVEVEKAPKPVAACAAQIAPSMRILTNSEKVRIARGGVMELLLINHPLDCPICDQAGECDLQDISEGYGYQTSRYREFKRAVEDKNIGPIIQTNMTRCIHCTRCVRFAEEVMGVYDLGTVGRGKGTEIGTYIEKMLVSEISGNLADLCPVGALTHGPYAFTSRPHELKTTSSIDLMEAIIPRVEFNYRGPEIKRTLPRVNEEVNDEWISDKSRYAYDGLGRQRLSVPLVRNKETGQFEEATWERSLDLISRKFQSVSRPENELVGMIGEFNSVEAAMVLKDLFGKFNSQNILHSNYPIKGGLRSDYLFNRKIPEIEELDMLLLIGANPKYETPVLNARILSGVRHNGLKVFKIGASDELGYKFYHLGNSTKLIEEIIDDKHPICDRIKKARNVHIVVSSGLSNEIENINELYHGLQNYVHKITKSDDLTSDIKKAEGYVTIGLLNAFTGPINGYEVGINYKSVTEIVNPKFVYNVGNDNEKLLKKFYESNPGVFTVYQGTNGDIGASFADVILPSSAWTESYATYSSLEGRIQTSKLVVPPPGLARDDWKILRVLSEELGATLPYDSIEELRYRIAEVAPYLLKYDFVEPYTSFNDANSEKIDRSKEFFMSTVIDNFYKTDAISRSSLVMAKCAAAFNPTKMNNFLKKSFD
jgi:NADH dehydrogenase (ubiquinone) Fe-S protein 1